MHMMANMHWKFGVVVVIAAMACFAITMAENAETLKGARKLNLGKLKGLINNKPKAIHQASKPFNLNAQIKKLGRRLSHLAHKEDLLEDDQSALQPAAVNSTKTASSKRPCLEHDREGKCIVRTHSAAADAKSKEHPARLASSHHPGRHPEESGADESRNFHLFAKRFREKNLRRRWEPMSTSDWAPWHHRRNSKRRDMSEGSHRMAPSPRRRYPLKELTSASFELGRKKGSLSKKSLHRRRSSSDASSKMVPGVARRFRKILKHKF